MFLNLFISSISFICFYNVVFNFDSIHKKILFYKGKFQRLNNLVSKKHDSKLMIWYCSIVIIIKDQYLKFLQYIDNRVVKINKNLYEISYIINDKHYKMLVNPEKGPKPYSKIFDENDIDITDEIQPYIGPCNDFHKFKITPNHLSKKKIIIHKYNGDRDIFEDEEIIIFS